MNSGLCFAPELHRVKLRSYHLSVTTACIPVSSSLEARHIKPNQATDGYGTERNEQPSWKILIGELIRVLLFLYSYSPRTLIQILIMLDNGIVSYMEFLVLHVWNEHSGISSYDGVAMFSFTSLLAAQNWNLVACGTTTDKCFLTLKT